ncbi:MobC family plasmid mobilization relaxosome protein [Streptomyces sp. NBC_01016]|uniref:plasmid mobilization relaxosome protein MobC n=1 Tax=Streptomyces sp. NBC_01016 TaxID=2903720 RepID=UPI00224E962F|nr:plasmid mobilization relaxosome protein MobC [Streptomyces sp. NBC_01016]MCX4827950.1 MobC family plasmid mobilization relaxosome protein [Streptomyces sp. NBC_01016]
MHNAPYHEPHTAQQEMSTSLNGGARYPVGPSKGRSNGGASAPGVAEARGRQGAPTSEKPLVDAELPLPRAADEAAVHRVARRRSRMPVQRTDRVDVRYSADEKAVILAKARSLNIAAAHYVGALVMAHINGDLGFTLPGQRTQLDDYIDELNALREQVTKIGRNVNQIAWRLNSGGNPHPGDSALLAQTDRTLDAVGTAVRHIANAANQAATNEAAE